MVVEAASVSSGVDGRLITPRTYLKCVFIYLPNLLFLQVKDFQAFQFLLIEHGFVRLYFFIFCA